MKTPLLLPFIVACALSTTVSATDVPRAGTFSVGAQVSMGNIDHDSFSSDQDAAAQVMFYVDYYVIDGWAVEVAVNSGSNIQDRICENADDTDDYCTSSNDSNPNSFESDLEFSNAIVALRFDKQVSENSFLYGKLGAQYFDYEMENAGNIFEEDSGSGIFSELGWKYQWSNNLNANVGYQFMGMSDLSTSSLTVGIGYRF